MGPIAVAFFVCFCGTANVDAQDGALLVLSQARTARGEPASLELVAFDPATLEPLASALALPGSEAPGRIAAAEDGSVVAIVTSEATSRDRSGPRSYLTFVRVDGWRRAPLSEPLGPREWNPFEILLAPADGSEGLRAVLLAGSYDGAWTAVITFALRSAGDRLDAIDPSVIRIAGAPRAIDVNWTSGVAHVLSTTYWGETLLASVDCRNSAEARDTPTVSLGADESVGRGAIKALPGGSAIAVLTSRRDSESSGRIRSRVRLFDSHTLQRVDEDLEIVGGTSWNATALAQGSTELWTATYSDAGAFAYATGLRVANGSLEKFAEHASTRAWRPPLVSVDPRRADVAVAVDQTLRVLGPDGLEQARLTGQSPIGALEWAAGNLFVGAGPVVLRVNPSSGAVQHTSAAARGHVVQLAQVSRVPSRSAPMEVNPLPAHVHFDGGSPGRAERILPLLLDAGQRVEVDVDDRTSQWLRLGDTASEDGVGIALSLRDPWLIQPPQDRLWGSVVVRKLGPDGSVVDGGESRIDVTASWARSRASIVQWQLSGLLQRPDPGGMESLRDILAAPPLHFSHRTRSGPLVEPPDASIVVIDLDAAAEGAMTRQVLLDYVAHGGGLLFVGRHAPEQPSEGLRRWLEPLDVLIEADRLVDGRFAVGPEDAGLLGLDQVAVTSGCYLEVSGRMDVLVAGLSPRNAALAMRRYGYGRIALLASAAPLKKASLARTGGRRFARGLFGWLAGGQFDVADGDFDGLPDRTEDWNGNGRLDRGETSYLNPDTDGDGIPDGAEDANFNGRVDEGETDPRLLDTDEDGLPDGADADPLPVAGTPILASVEPERGPAEGGTMVEISGRNLPPSPEVWFGDSRSPHVIRIDSTRILAATPEQPREEMEETLPIRVSSRPGAPQAELVEGFTFHDRSRARLALESIAQTRRAYDGYHGQFSLVLEVPEVSIEEVRFSLWIDPGLERLELNLERSAELAALGRTISLRRYGLYEHRITVSPGGLLTGRIDLGMLTFRLSEVPAPVERLRAFFRVPHVRAQWGGVLLDGTEETWIDLAGAVEDPRRFDDSHPAPG